MRGVEHGVEVAVREKGPVAWLEFALLRRLGFMSHAVSTRRGGVSETPGEGLNLSFRVGDQASRVAENRALFARALGWDARRLTTVQQVHGEAVVCAAPGDAGRGAQDDPLAEADAILTNHPRVPIFIQTADCLPLILADPVRKVVGVVHAGWKGTFLGIAEKAVAKMVDHYGTRAVDVRAVLGPCIGPCCYEVETGMRDELRAKVDWADEAFRDGFHGRLHLDLAEINARQLRAAGLLDEHVVKSGICVVQNLDLFYSHRAEAGKTGRFGTFVMVR